MVTKIDRNFRSKWHQIVIKIEALGVQGRIFDIFMDFGKLVVLMFFHSRTKVTNKSTLGRRDGPQNVTLDAIYNPARPLYWQILARLYILLFDNADTSRCRWVLDFEGVPKSTIFA